jgi:hypothetical protein
MTSQSRDCLSNLKLKPALAVHLLLILLISYNRPASKRPRHRCESAMVVPVASSSAKAL